MSAIHGESDERRALRSAVATLGAAYGPRYFVDNARAGRFPHDLWSDLASYGYAGVNIAEQYGGPGGTLSDLAAVAEELAAAGCPLMTLVVSPAVCGPLLSELGNPAQQVRWLAGIGDGSVRMAFAMTESEAGSNSHQIRTRARRRGESWSLIGEKHFISGVDESAAMLVVARAESATGDDDGLTIFALETDRPGVRIAPIPMHVHAAERQFIVTFEDVEVSEADLVGQPGAGLAHLFHGLNPERVASAATCVGIGRYCVEKAAAYARERRVWDVPIGAHQGVAHPLAQAYVAVETAALMMAKAAALYDVGEPCGTAATMAKLVAAEAAALALDTAIQTHGGNGLSEEYHLAHLWGLVRMYAIAPISREMSLNHIATHALGLPRSY